MAESLRPNPVRSAIRYQDAASHLLMNSCPTVSRFLQHEINEGVTKSRIDMPSTRKHQVCSSCGSIATLSNSSTINGLGGQSKQQHPKRGVCRIKGHADDFKPIITQCTVCNYHSKSWMDRKDRNPIHSKPVKMQAQSQSLSEKNTTRTSRSKTQAMRKKGNSLQAMLANSKKNATSSTSSFGLSLMDLMKSG